MIRYDLKVERGWVGSGNSCILAVDTRTSSQTGKMGLTPWWHVLSAGLILLPCILPGVREYLRVSEDGWIFFISGLAVSLAFGALHIVIRRMRNKVYSEDSEVNLKVNLMQKNAWTWSLVGGSLSNAAAYLFVADHMDAEKWISTWVYAVYIILESAPILFFIGGMLYVRYKKRELLACDESPLHVDDDVYWKNGWYSNPHDKRLIVQDSVEITSGYSDETIRYDEVQDIRLLERLPEDDYKKINGGDTKDMLMGKFRGKESGKCILYLYTKTSPVLEISTADGPVYVNSRSGEETEAWYAEIEKNLR